MIQIRVCNAGRRHAVNDKFKELYEEIQVFAAKDVHADDGGGQSSHPTDAGRPR